MGATSTEDALARAKAYAAAGVDAFFFVGIKDRAQLEAAAAAIDIPIIIGGGAPELSDLDYLAAQAGARGAAGPSADHGGGAGGPRHDEGVARRRAAKGSEGRALAPSSWRRRRGTPTTRVGRRNSSAGEHSTIAALASMTCRVVTPPAGVERRNAPTGSDRLALLSGARPAGRRRSKRAPPGSSR